MAKKINKKQENIIIPRKAFIPMICLVPLIALILSKRDVGGLGLLIIGVGAGILIGKGFFEKLSVARSSEDGSGNVKLGKAG